MGATNEIKETNISLQLEGKNCPQCEQTFTQEEIDDRNYDIWFDTTNDVRLIEMTKLSKEDASHYYYPSGRTGYELRIWIRSIEHETCPDTEKCQGCVSKYLTKQMKELKGNIYCQACYVHLINRKKNHE